MHITTRFILMCKHIHNCVSQLRSNRNNYHPAISSTLLSHCPPSLPTHFPIPPPTSFQVRSHFIHMNVHSANHSINLNSNKRFVQVPTGQTGVETNSTVLTECGTLRSIITIHQNFIPWPHYSSSTWFYSLWDHHQVIMNTSQSKIIKKCNALKEVWTAWLLQWLNIRARLRNLPLIASR